MVGIYEKMPSQSIQLKPQNISMIIRQTAPFQQKSKEINLHILLPNRLFCPFSPFLGNLSALCIMRLHLHPTRRAKQPPYALSTGYGAIHARKVRQRAPHPVQAEINRGEMQPWSEPAIEPLPEDARFEWETARLQEREKSAAEPSAVEVEEVAVLPGGLEIDPAGCAEFFALRVALAAVFDRVGYVDVGLQTERGCGRCPREYLVGVVRWVVRGGK